MQDVLVALRYEGTKHLVPPFKYFNFTLWMPGAVALHQPLCTPLVMSESTKASKNQQEKHVDLSLNIYTRFQNNKTSSSPAASF